MKLRSKALITIGIIWAVICLAVFIDSKLILQKNFESQENKLAIKDINRVRNALQNQMDALALYTNSWSQWDDAYQFMRKKSAAFIKSSFVPATYTSASLNFFLFYDSNGKPYFGQAFDLTKNEVMPIPPGLMATLDTHHDFVTHAGKSPSRVGIFKIPEGIVILSSLPVLDSEAKQPSRGALMMGYFLSEKHIAAIAKTVDMKLQFYPLPLSKQNPKLKSALNNLTSGQPYYLVNKNNKVTDGYTLINDIDGNAVGLIQVEIPRMLYMEGMTTLTHFRTTMLMIGIILMISLWYVLKKMVLDRILHISSQVVEINTNGSFNKRIALTGNDELTAMTASLNSMLELIELTQDQLKYRISRGTKDLEKVSKLNRNLFSEMGKQKTMETKLREDEKILRQLAYYDTLTNLPNRAFFNELLAKALSQAEHDNNKVAVLFIDVDKFKKINDTYGHDFGDKFLKEVAARLKRSITSTDVAARLAGDEFILFLTNVTSTKMIDDAVENVFQHLTAIVSIDKITINPTFSMGISVYPDNSKTIEELCHQADLAMYYAKKREGNIYYYFGTVENVDSTTTPY